MTDPKHKASGKPHLDFLGCAMLVAMALVFGLAIRFLFNVVRTYIAASQ